MSGFHIVSKNPWIIHGYNYGNIFSPVKQFAPYLDCLDNEVIHYLITLTWTILPQRRIERLARYYHRHIRRYPRQKVTFLANESAELELLQRYEIPAILCNHNALLDERRYTIKPGEKRYSSVMNSRMAPYKRIELACEVPDCCLITYFLAAEDHQYERKIYGSPENRGKISPMPLMKFPQYENGHYVHYFSIDQITEIYGQSSCGLILSAEEGGCFASLEYLLCGLPVVTTPNIGGRDEFFDEDYVIWAEADSQSVAAAVERAKCLPISAQEIRNRTLVKIQQHRENYIQLLNAIAREEGVERDFRKEWDSFFINKMHINMSEADAVACLHEQGLDVHYPVLHRLHNGHKVFKAWLKGLKQAWKERKYSSRYR